MQGLTNNLQTQQLQDLTDKQNSENQKQAQLKSASRLQIRNSKKTVILFHPPFIVCQTN